MNFGTHEGLHFDNLPDSEKAKFSDPEFKAFGGESWPDVRQRAETLFKTFKNDEVHYVFTHGGLITSYLYQQGVYEMPPNASLLAVTLKDDNSGEPEDLHF